MADPTTVGKIAGALATLIAALKFTPAAARQVTGPLLIVGAIFWLGMESVEQLKANNDNLIESIDRQTQDIIDAVKKITDERTKEANIIKQVLESIDNTQNEIVYLRGRVDQIDGKEAYKDARYNTGARQ